MVKLMRTPLLQDKMVYEELIIWGRAMGITVIMNPSSFENMNFIPGDLH